MLCLLLVTLILLVPDTAPAPVVSSQDLTAALLSESAALADAQSNAAPDLEESGGDEEGVCYQSAPAPGGVVRIGMVGRPESLNPLLLPPNDPFLPLARTLYRGLSRYDAQEGIVPDLASGWTISDDGLSVTFDLRSDLFWQDGTPISVSDILYTYGLVRDPYFEPILQDWPLWQAVSVEASGGNQVKFNLPSSFSPFLTASTLPILPAHIWQNVPPAELKTVGASQLPIGNYYFRAANLFERDGFLRLIPNPAAWESPPYLNELIIRFYPDGGAALEDFAASEIDMLFGIDHQLLSNSGSLPDSQLFTVAERTLVQLVFNLSDDEQPVIEPELRQALLAGLDRQRLVDQALNGQAILFEGPYLPSSPVYDPYIYPLAATEPLSASLQLDSIGWQLPAAAPSDDGGADESSEGESPSVATPATVVDEAGEAIRAREEEQLTLTLLLPLSNEATLIGQELAAQWGALGVDLQTVALGSAEFDQALQAGAFDMVLLTLQPTLDPDQYDLWSQEAIVRGNNWGGWNNRAASETLESARLIWEMSERLPYYQAFLNYHREDLPALSLYQPVNSWLVSEEIGGIDPNEIKELHETLFSFNLWFRFQAEELIACDY